MIDDRLTRGYAAALWTARALAILGFLDATYLTMSHYAGAALACGPGGGCDVVTSSRFATLGDLPIAAIGVGFYVVASLVAWTPAARWDRRPAALLLAITALAALVSALLVYLQAVVIHAWCRFCLLSAAITAGLFLCSVVLFRRSPAVARSRKGGTE